MFETIKRLYESGKLTQAGVEEAVKKGWITKEQAQLIIEGPDPVEKGSEETEQ